MELALAPLQTFTDHHFRNALHSIFGGVDRYYAPYLKLNNDGTIKSSTLKDIHPTKNNRFPIVPQVMASTPNDFMVMYREIERLGYPELNLNIGCPYPMVTNKCLGAALTENQSALFHMLDVVIPQIKLKLGIKMRMGMTNTHPILTLLPQLNHYPLSEIIVHARYAKQLYTGECDIERFIECEPITLHKLYYNGDITNLNGFKTLQEKLSVNSFMIGRGAMVQPNIFQQLKSGQASEITKNEYLDFHHELKESLLNDNNEAGHILNKLKGYWEYLCEGCENGQQLFRKIKKAKKYQEIDDLIEDYLE